MANNFHSNDVQNDLGTKQILLLENLQTSLYTV